MSKPESYESIRATARAEFGPAGEALVDANVAVLAIAALREQAQHGNETAKARLEQLRADGIDA